MSTECDNPRHEQDRNWFTETFAPASQLESRIIPDILGAEEGPCRFAGFPAAVSGEQLDAVKKRLGCTDDVLLDTAFGLTLSV